MLLICKLVTEYIMDIVHLYGKARIIDFPYYCLHYQVEYYTAICTILVYILEVTFVVLLDMPYPNSPYP